MHLVSGGGDGIGSASCFSRCAHECHTRRGTRQEKQSARAAQSGGNQIGSRPHARNDFIAALECQPRVRCTLCLDLYAQRHVQQQPQRAVGQEVLR